ncbi:Uncharacterised protein [Mycobacterium tuberculosis]|nr:Uncharacterised protein [Mycobacterium tuberculosis]CNW38987.1 Uncharacterised protein [Mycobacterium tuberculosis]CPA34038.1 Uncharacterised protein [Mycobacterium tuberculosis]
MVQCTFSGIRSERDDGEDISPSMWSGAYQTRRGRLPARFMASAALPAGSRPPLVMKLLLPTTVMVRPSARKRTNAPP